MTWQPPDSPPTVPPIGRGWIVAFVVGLFALVVTIPWVLADGDDALGAPATQSASASAGPASATKATPGTELASDGAPTPTSTSAKPSASAKPSTSNEPARLPNPAATAGTAMVAGVYRCYVRDGTEPAAPLDVLGYLLDVRTESGWYVWDGQPGSYVMTRSSLSNGEDVWGDVTFQTGPLQNVKAHSSATIPDAASGVAATAVVLFRDGSNRYCATGG